MKTFARLILNALAAWVTGLLLISVILYFSNGGADFTLTDVMGFGVIAVVASGLLMVAVYLPSLYWLRRRLNGLQPRKGVVVLCGLICNIPIFLLLAFLMITKLPPAEALGFMLTFLAMGASFGLGFTLINRSSSRAE